MQTTVMEPGYVCGYYVSSKRITPVRWNETASYARQMYDARMIVNPIPNAPLNRFGAFPVARQVYDLDDGIVPTNGTRPGKFFAENSGHMPKPGRIPAEVRPPRMFHGFG